MKEKYCVKCEKVQPIEEFHKNKNSRDGYHSSCKYQLYNKKKVNKTDDPDYNKKKSRENYAKNREQRLEAQREWYKKNKKSANAYMKHYFTTEQGKLAKKVYDVKRRARKINATPEWADSRYIKLFYMFAKLEAERTGRVVHVDHIVPLNSPKVCGLHNEFNLQLMYAEDNIKKTNSFLN